MKKRLLCVLVAAALLLGILTGCGSGAENGGSSSSPDSGKTGVESKKPDVGGHTTDGPAAVMNERVKAVNDALNWEFFRVEETVEEGLLFYSLSQNSISSGETHDYNPDKPLDYEITYKMVKQHTKGIVSEDTYVPLLRTAWDSFSERLIPLKLRSVSAEDVIETDDLYIWYDLYDSIIVENIWPQIWIGSPYAEYDVDELVQALHNDYGYPIGHTNASVCFILVKGTDILYRFETKEIWLSADDNENDYGGVYISDDAEYMFTTEFWKAFAQTAKFAGKADDDFEDDEYINSSVSTMGKRGYEDHHGPGIVEFPLPNDQPSSAPSSSAPSENPYAGETMRLNEIREGFKKFLESFNGNYGYIEGYGFLVIDDFGQGEPTMFLNNALYKYIGNGEVTLIHDFSDIDDFWMSMSTDADRTHLLFSAGYPFGEDIKIVDLRTFEITNEISADYDLNSDGMPIFLSGAINGVPVDEETALAACADWGSICNIHLLGRGGIDYVDLNNAWNEYTSRG